MHVKLKHIFIYLFLILTSLFALKAFFHSGFYTSHDSWTQVTRLYHFDQAIRVGQIPPRYSFNLLFGYGYPLFTFSYHMPWIMAEPFVLFGVSIFASIKIVFIVSFIISGIAMYIWQRELWGNLGGLVASFLYLWAPYRFAVLFVRAAIGEAVSFMFIPLLFYGIHLCAKKRTISGVLIGSLGLAGLILSHVMVVYMLILPLLTYIVYLIQSEIQPKKFIFDLIKLITLGLLLASYYLIPAFLYQNLTVFPQIKQLAFHQQFLKLRDVLYSPWGYAPAFTGIGEMSMQLGITQWLVTLSALIVFMAQILKKRWQSKKTKLIGYQLFVFLICLFLTLTASKIVWQTLRDFIPVDLPWRFLSMLMFIAALCGGFITYILPKSGKKVFVLGIILLAVYANRNHIRVNEYTDIPLWLYIASEQTTNTFTEYLPKWAQMHDVTDIKHSEVTHPVDSVVRNYQQTVNNVQFEYENKSQDSIAVRVIYFPDIRVFVDNQIVNFSWNDLGFISFQVKPGLHKIRLIYTESILEKTADGLTIVGMGIFVIGCIYALKNKRQEKIAV